MPKYAHYLIFLLLAACHPTWRENSSAAYQHLPALNILLPDSSRTFSTMDIPRSRSTIIFYFNPTCEKCQDMTVYLMKNLNALRHTTIVFVSLESLSDIRAFTHHYLPGQHDNIIVGADYQYKFFNKYKIASFPQIIIYNNQQELTKLYKEEVYIDQIVKAINS